MADYYFDATLGNDSTGDGSIGTPWQTIAKVNSATFSAGDTVNFKRGETWSGTMLTCDNSGTDEDNMITYQAYGSGDKPILKNPGSSYERIIYITADWVKIKNLYLEDTHDAGVHIASGADNNIVEYLEITDTGRGARVHGEYTEIRYCYIHDLHMVVDDATPDNDYGAVGIWFFASNNEFHHNILENCRAVSTDYGYDGGAFEVWAAVNVTDCKIHHNWTTGCEGFFEVAGTTGTNNSVSNIEVYYNVSYNDYHLFTAIHGTTAYWGVDLSNFTVYNNTIIDTIDYDDPFYSKIAWVGTSGAGNYIFKNNIVYLNDFWYVSKSDDNGWDWVHEYNCYGGSFSSLGFTKSTGEIEQDPEFVNVSTEDFNLQSSSPCVDAGTDVSLTQDYDGKAIPYNIIPDIGAYEYTETALEINVELKRA